MGNVFGSFVSIDTFLSWSEARQLDAIRDGRLPPKSILHAVIRKEPQCSLKVYDALLALTTLEEHNELDQTPLTRTLIHNRHDLALHLLEKGARVGVPDGPLLHLHREHLPRVVPALFEHGGAAWCMGGTEERYSVWAYNDMRAPAWKEGLDASVWADFISVPPESVTVDRIGIKRSLIHYFCRFEQSVRDQLHGIPVVSLQDIVLEYLFSEFPDAIPRRSPARSPDLVNPVLGSQGIDDQIDQLDVTTT